MAYFAVIKISDIDGNVVELADVSPTLADISNTLKRIEAILAHMADTDLAEENSNRKE